MFVEIIIVSGKWSYSFFVKGEYMYFPKEYYIENSINENEENLILQYAEYNMKYLIERYDARNHKKSNEGMWNAHKRMRDFMPKIKDIHMTMIEANVYLLIAAGKLKRLDVLYDYIGGIEGVEKIFLEWYPLFRNVIMLGISNKKISDAEQSRFISMRVKIKQYGKKWAENFYVKKAGLIFKSNNRLGTWVYEEAFAKAVLEWNSNSIYHYKELSQEIKVEFSKYYGMELLKNIASIYKNGKAEVCILDKLDDKIIATVNGTRCSLEKKDDESLVFRYPVNKCESLHYQGEFNNIGFKRIWHCYSLFVNNIFQNDINAQFIYAHDTDKKIINNKDVIVKSNIRYCESKRHDVVDVIAKLQVKKLDGTIVWNCLHAAYCKDCNRYYILTNDYSKLEGVPLCRVITIRKGKKHLLSDNVDSRDIAAAESLIHSYGYNVNINDNLTEEYRRNILVSLIENKMVSQEIVLSYLDALILRGQGNVKYNNAVKKWRSDREYIEKLWYIESEITVSSITENK